MTEIKNIQTPPFAITDPNLQQPDHEASGSTDITALQGYLPTESRVFSFRGVKGSTDDENDRHSDKAVALRALKNVISVQKIGLIMSPKLVADSLARLGYELRTIDDLQLVKKLEEDQAGGVKIYDNGLVIGYANVPVSDTRKVLASPEGGEEESMQLQRLAAEVVILEEDEQKEEPKQAVEAVVMMPESNSPDYSYLLKQSDIDLSK